MKILMVAAEFSPYAKTGGLADAVSALSRELVGGGDDVRVLVPLHGCISERWRRDMRPLSSPIAVHLSEERWGRVHELIEPEGLHIYFLEHHQFFSRERPYDDGYSAYVDNPQRFAFFCRAAVDLADFLDWTPDIFHCHDWMAALVPVYLETVARGGRLRHSASLLTVHNIAYQGYADHSLLDWAGLPDWLYRSDKMEACGGVNVLKGGLYFANKLTTVSPGYAQEIRREEFACGLQDVTKFRSGDLIGVLNGIDSKIWDPATDPHLAASYDGEHLAGKKVCKSDLCKLYGLRDRPSVPLFGVVSRLCRQKGLDVLVDAFPWILDTMELQFVLLGAGDWQLEEHFRGLARTFSDRVSVHIGYDEALAHRIEAGCDFFLMPSRFEPCGLNQLYSLRYGTLPIVRATGGLRDTVQNYNEETGDGTGFLFNDLTPNAIHGTVGWACYAYHNRPDHIETMIRRAMGMDFSWKISAQRYRHCYRWALETKR